MLKTDLEVVWIKAEAMSRKGKCLYALTW